MVSIQVPKTVVQTQLYVNNWLVYNNIIAVWWVVGDYNKKLKTAEIILHNKFHTQINCI
jgi:hypothetical protein